MSVVTQRPAARRDVVALAEYIRKDSPRTALRFVRAVHSTYRSVAAQPGMGGPCELAVEGLRVIAVSGFRNHLVYYRPIEDGVEILRVLHAGQDAQRIFGEPSS
jgi:toxin ParE1/3/4